jgi:hypothetical protein
MKKIWVPLCLVLGFAMLAYSLYFWGGIACTPEIGAIVRERASTFSFIAWSYISAGFGLLNMLGWQEGAIEFAHQQLGDVLVSTRASPLTAMDDLFKALPWFCRVSYYGGPLLILIGAFAQQQKPKAITTFGSR